MSGDQPAAHALTYPLQGGFVVNWLVAGPSTGAVAADWEDGPGITGAPVERGPLDTGLFQVGEQRGAWAYYACPEDRVVDRSGDHRAGLVLRSWAAADLVVEAEQSATVELTASGAAGLWLDGAAVLRVEHGSGSASVALTPGVHAVMVRFEDVAVGETAHTAALRVQASGVQVQIPTRIPDLGRRASFEQLTAHTYLDRDVYEGGAPIRLCWPEGERAFCPAHVRLHGTDDGIFALADIAGMPGDATELGYAVQLPAGPMRASLSPSPDEVYLHHTRVWRDLPFWSLGRQQYVAQPSDADLPARRREALLAIAEHERSPYGQIARMALGVWQDVDAGVLVRACEQPDAPLLLALVGLVCRFGAEPALDGEVRAIVEEALLQVERWPSPTTSTGRILLHAARLLAGQRFPDRLFADGLLGTRRQAEGERLALTWMADFAAYGATSPGDSEAIAYEAAALASLADLAESPAVYELAAVCLDKLLYLLALSSRRGVLCAATTSAPPSVAISGLLQPTAPISRLLWGVGIYNQHLAGVLALALATEYEPPAILDGIAQDAPAAVWSRERHAPPGAVPTSLVTYKTPEYVLSSLADVPPGGPGRTEQLWRATLSPSALVFVNQPASSSRSDSRVPAYWAGNARLPRVGQWQDALIAMHRVFRTDRLPFTHAYFPTAAFDEYVVRDGWAFARVGEGYLALACTAGLALTTAGRDALRELRAPRLGSRIGPVDERGPAGAGGPEGDDGGPEGDGSGPEGDGSGPEGDGSAVQTWLVQLGRAALDGDFPAFQAAVLQSPFDVGDDGSVSWTTMRGDTFTLGWDRPPTLNGAPVAGLEGSHLDSPYAAATLPCAGIDIRLHEDILRLDFMTS
ncbi:MAG: hypothetical protein IT306_07800 [Chloroflexi bacterium]|nr:hypothetical protein [Chloroflexota bacterium]